MNLSFNERIKIPTTLPKESSLEKIKYIKSIKEKLVFNEDEQVKFGIKVLEYAVCDSCGNQFFIHDGNIDPEKSEHKCPKCNSSDYTKTGQRQFTWIKETERDTEIDLDVHEISILTEALEMLNDQGKVTEDMIGLYEKLSLNF